MYKDAREELQRLEDALLEEEAIEEETLEEDTEEALLAATQRIESLEQVEEQTPDLAATRRIYNADPLDVDLEDYARQVQEAPKSLTGLIIAAAALAAGVIGILVWWLLRYGAMLG